ncbi:MAG: hypothetical protein ACFFCV_15825 [Promethearchaeota archaeon]
MFKELSELSFLTDEDIRNFFLNMFECMEMLENFTKIKYDEFCKEDKYKEINEYVHRQNELSRFEKTQFKVKFQEELEKLKVKNEYRKNQFEIWLKEDKEKKNIEERLTKLNRRRKGYTNIKPMSFYEELHMKDDSPLNYDDEYYLKIEIEYDTYFEETGTPKRIKNDQGYWYGDDSITKQNPERYELADTPEMNQKFLDRCKEIANILINLRDSDFNKYTLKHIEILQKYLSKKYLITRQIAFFSNRLSNEIIDELSTDPNNPHRKIKNHPCREYDIDIYSNHFDLELIKEDIEKFIQINKSMELTPFGHLRKYLINNNNEITIPEYATLINNTYKVAMTRLKKFEKEKGLKSKRVGKSHKLIFYILKSKL